MRKYADHLTNEMMNEKVCRPLNKWDDEWESMQTTYVLFQGLLGDVHWKIGVEVVVDAFP